MKTFIGTKLIEAEPMTAEEATLVLGREINIENADEEGNGYLVKYKDGYISWSPKQAFEEAYRPLNKLTFGDAIHLLK